MISNRLMSSACGVMLLLTAAHSVAKAQCEPAWSDRFALRGVSGTVHATTVWNDGGGDKVYVAGDFSSFDALSSVGVQGAANGIVAWDGERWVPLGLGVGPSGQFQSGLRVVHALTPFDPDGPGPLPSSLIVGGEFIWVSGQQIKSVARWDGANWSEMGGGVFGTFSTLNNRLAVRSMAVYDADGVGPALPELYIAGDFEYAGNTYVNGVARWDGTQWRDVGGPFPAGTHGQRLAVFDPDGDGPLLAQLYLGGTFSQVPDGLGDYLPAQGLARWDGASWTDEPGIQMKNVNDLAVFDNGAARELWVGGGLLPTAGSIIYPTVARKTGGIWAHFGSAGVAPFYSASALRQLGGHMYVSGSVPGTSDTFVRWSPAAPAAFQPVGTAIRGQIDAILPVDFDLAGPLPSKLLVAGGDAFHRVTALQDPVAGVQAFSNAAVWNGTFFEPTPTSGSTSLGLGIPTNGSPLQVSCLRSLDPDGAGPQPEKLFIAGTFNGAGATITGNAAVFDGSTFGGLPFWPEAGDTPPNPTAYDDASYPIALDFATMPVGSSTTLFASAYDSGSGGGTIGRWDGTRFYPIGFPGGSAQRIIGFDDGSGMALWAFGAFGDVSVNPSLNMPGGSIAANGSARWRPTTGWESADVGIPAVGFSIRDAIVYNSGGGDAIFAAGFTFEFPSRHLARWNGSTWDFSPITSLTGENTIIRAVRVFNGELYAAGRFLSVNGVSAAGIARWNGTSWSPVGGGLSDSANGAAGVNVYAMSVHNDGAGMALYVSGRFTHADGLPARNIAKWNGSVWSTVGTAEAGGGWTADTMASFRGGLYIGAGFQIWDGKSAAGMSVYERPCNPCPADFNGSGSLTIDDLFLFINAWFSSLPGADFNGANGITIDDLFLYLNAYFVGC